MPTQSDPMAQLERAFIDEFLQQRGYTFATIHSISDMDAATLLKEASSYASGRLTELESRAHYVRDIHDSARSMPARHRRGPFSSLR
jgi:hypothetical protein